MIIVSQANGAADEMNKPVICPKCGRGIIGSIPEWSKATISRRGKPPPGEHSEGVRVKCTICGSFWSIIIE